MRLTGKSVLVTGGAGFIGSHLVEGVLAGGASRVIIVDDLSLGRRANLSGTIERDDVYLYEEDAGVEDRMAEIIETHDVNVVFNLAVVPLPTSFDEPRRCVETNMNIVMALCELGRAGTYDHLVHYSSSEVYGSMVEEPMSESHPLNGTTPYAASKIGGDKLVQSYMKTHELDALIVRPFNNFGPRQNYREYAGVIPITVRRILEGNAPIVYGDGSQTRDFVFVKDTVAGTLDLVSEPAAWGEVVNLASGEEVTIRELIEEIAHYMEFDGEIQYRDERTADLQRHRGDTTKAHGLVGFEPSTDFEDGLHRTVDWYVDEFEAL